MEPTRDELDHNGYYHDKFVVADDELIEWDSDTSCLSFDDESESDLKENTDWSDISKSSLHRRRITRGTLIAQLEWESDGYSTPLSPSPATSGTAR